MMVRSYSTLVIDLDGTLLDRHGRVSDNNRRAIDRVREAGLSVLVASGRAWAESQAALDAIKHGGPMIAAGGALLCNASDGSTIDSRTMALDVVRDAVLAMMEADHRALLLKDRAIAGHDYVTIGHAPLDPASEWWFNHLPVEVRHVEHLQEDEHPAATVRVAVVAGESELNTLALHLNTHLGERAFLQHWPAVTSSHAVGGPTHLLEVFNASVNKWTMIERYCMREGIDPSTVIAIGDGLNDVEMIQHAGLGVAMGNADPRVAAVADHVTTHHEEDGVAAFVESLLESAA